jgi:hypothetical protein
LTSEALRRADAVAATIPAADPRCCNCAMWPADGDTNDTVGTVDDDENEKAFAEISPPPPPPDALLCDTECAVVVWSSLSLSPPSPSTWT